MNAARWYVMVSSGLFVHMRRWCVFGLCTAMNNQMMQPEPASIIIAFTLCCVISSFDWWPAIFKKKITILSLLLDSFITIVLMDLILKLIWEPIIPHFKIFGEILLLTSSHFGLHKHNKLQSIGELMQTECSLSSMRLGFSVLFLFYMLYISNELDRIQIGFNNSFKSCKCFVNNHMHVKSSKAVETPTPTSRSVCDDVEEDDSSFELANAFIQENS